MPRTCACDSLVNEGLKGPFWTFQGQCDFLPNWRDVTANFCQSGRRVGAQPRDERRQIAAHPAALRQAVECCGMVATSAENPGASIKRGKSADAREAFLLRPFFRQNIPAVLTLRSDLLTSRACSPFRYTEQNETCEHGLC